MAQTVTREELSARVGERLGVSDWFLVDQERVNQFADVTLDHQFVHVDLERAKQDAVRRHDRARLPHAVAARAAVSRLHPRARESHAARELRIRQDPVRRARARRQADSRASARSPTVAERKPGNVIIKMDVTVEIENEDKPALVAEWLSLHVVG